jgi:hypothetical protein
MMTAKSGGVILMFVWLGVSSCATVPTGPLAQGELRLIRMHAPESIRAGEPYEVLITFQAGGEPQISRACFFWSGAIPREGPYCFGVFEINQGPPATFKVRLRTRNPRTYILDGYAEYLRGGGTEKTNEVSTQIYVW